jgi:site-specific recombinase XerD
MIVIESYFQKGRRMADNFFLTSTDWPNERTWLIQLATDGVTSLNSKRNYERALTDFLNWWHEGGRPTLSKALVNAYRAHLMDWRDPKTGKPYAASAINAKLSAIRKLISEAHDNGLIDPQTANGIKAVKGLRVEGQRLGHWLNKQEAQDLINAPDVATLKGLRDRAILAVLVGAALRREEAVNLTLEHIQQREGRWVIVDLVGKRGKTRSVPIPAWVKMALDAWTSAAEITTGRVFRSIRKGDHLDKTSTGMSTPAIWGVVNTYATAIGFPTLAPHDLRRTAAKLMEKGGAAINQISLVLGHSSLDVTKRYLGGDLDLHDAATDRIKIDLTNEGDVRRRLPGMD